LPRLASGVVPKNSEIIHEANSYFDAEVS